MAVFDKMPRIEGSEVLLREMVDADADNLYELAHCDDIYRLEPTYLYERQYEDAHEAIAQMNDKCFETRESVILAVCLKSAPDDMLGIAEVYAYEPRKPKASIGVRLLKRAWGQGIATETVGLLKDWLLSEGVRTITAHVMVENYSGRTAEKNGFVKLYPNCLEDWGFDEPVLVDKWVYKKRWAETGPDAPKES